MTTVQVADSGATLRREKAMAGCIVIGVFEDKGTAEHACGRLKLEGVPESDLAVRVLKEIGPIPKSMQLELETLSVDPFFWLFEAIGGDYAKFIRNGETLVCVRADSNERVRRASEVMLWYGPINIEVVGRSDEGKVLRDLKQAGPGI